MNKNTTLVFLCSMCNKQTSFPQDISLGDNTTDFTCSGCGEQWHVFFEVTSIEPLHIGTSLMKREIGVLKDGTFFAKEQLQ